MIFIIFILIAVLVMLFTTKPKQKFKWLRYTLIVILIGLLTLLVVDYIHSLTQNSGIRPY